jgi:hypothetical protein
MGVVNLAVLPRGETTAIIYTECLNVLKKGLTGTSARTSHRKGAESLTQGHFVRTPENSCPAVQIIIRVVADVRIKEGRQILATVPDAGVVVP